MAPLDLEVAETCALGHMGGADGFRAFGFKYLCGNSRRIFTGVGEMRDVPFRQLPR